MFAFVCVSVCIFVFTVFAVPNLGRDPHLKECYFFASPNERHWSKLLYTLSRLEFGNSEKNPWNFLTFVGNFWMGTLGQLMIILGGPNLGTICPGPIFGSQLRASPLHNLCFSTKKWLQSHRTWCHCNVKMDSFVKISSRIFWMTYKWWTQEGGGNLEFREEQEVSRSTRKCCESCPTRRGSGGKFPPLQKWLPKRQISGFGHLGGEKMYRSFKSTQFVCNDVTT